MNLKIKINDVLHYVELNDNYLAPIFKAIKCIKLNNSEIVRIYFDEIEDLLFKTTKFSLGENHGAKYISLRENYKNVLKVIEIIFEKHGCKMSHNDNIIEIKGK